MEINWDQLKSPDFIEPISIVTPDIWTEVTRQGVNFQKGQIENGRSWNGRDLDSKFEVNFNKEVRSFWSNRTMKTDDLSGLLISLIKRLSSLIMISDYLKILEWRI